ncbi:MAG: DUF6179 domain-containing protein [Syntrophomonadaceae bacterium]
MIHETIDGRQPSIVAPSAPVYEYLILELLAKGQQSRFLTASAVQKIQSEILILLQDKIRQYNHSESSSVRVDTAEYILRSILYTLDLSLMDYHDDQQLLSILNCSPVISIYLRGLELLEEQLKESRLLYRQVTMSQLDHGTFAYESTIKLAFPEFFSKYDLSFGAHDTITSIDYPVYNDDCSVSGIRYIKQYLQKLELENRFCMAFSPSSMKRLLQKYGHVYGIDYRDTLANISEIILGNGVFALLAGDYPGGLNISALQFKILRDMLQSLQEQAIHELIDRAQSKLLNQLGLSDRRYIDYYADFPANLTPRIIQARENNSLANVIVVYSMPSTKANHQFFQGPKLDSMAFCTLVEQLLQCSDCSAKINLIGSRVKSFDDFLDILEADCLDGDDYQTLFQNLSNLELSLLLTAALPEEAGCKDFDQICATLDSRDNQHQWRTNLKQFLTELPAERIKAVKYSISS